MSLPSNGISNLPCQVRGNVTISRRVYNMEQLQLTRLSAESVTPATSGKTDRYRPVAMCRSWTMSPDTITESPYPGVPRHLSTSHLLFSSLCPYPVTLKSREC